MNQITWVMQKVINTHMYQYSFLTNHDKYRERKQRKIIQCGICQIF